MGTKKAIEARPIGRFLRLGTGIALVFEGSRHLIGGADGLMLGVLLVISLEFGFYLGLHFTVARFFSDVNPWAGAALAVAPLAAVFLLGNAPGRLGTLLFVGVSLLFTAARGDGGCEVMTLPGMLMGKRTHLVCIAFSPIDWVENRIARRRSGG